MQEKNIFYIVLNIKTAHGYEGFGKFCLGEDKKAAIRIFNQLAGTDEVDDKTVLHMELRENRHGLPINILMRGCSLEDVAENCRIITRETFKLLNLEPSKPANT
jgi:hypothetical protein